MLFMKGSWNLKSCKCCNSLLKSLCQSRRLRDRHIALLASSSLLKKVENDAKIKFFLFTNIQVQQEYHISCCFVSEWVSSRVGEQEGMLENIVDCVLITPSLLKEEHRYELILLVKTNDCALLYYCNV